MKTERCRHSKIWIIAGGYWTWCYACGAIQKNRVEPPNISIPVSKWIKPVGKEGNNPSVNAATWKDIFGDTQ